MFRFGAMLRDKGKAALNEGACRGRFDQIRARLIERAITADISSHPRRNLHPPMPPSLDPDLARARAGARGPARRPAELGALPEWDLTDLYPGMDTPGFRADLARAEAECKAFAETYRGKLDGARRGAPTPRMRSARPSRRYEAIEDLLGRIMSYAGLVYSGDTTDPNRAKFYGDTQERLTAASSELLFFALELNRIDDAVLDAAMAGGAARPLPALDRGPPQGQALPARGPDRAAVPREVGHRARGLEPPVRRDHRLAPLRRCAARS